MCSHLINLKYLQMLLLLVWFPEKIKGKFSAEKRNNYNVIYLVDPNWKNSSMNNAHDLRDVHVRGW